MNLHGVAWLAIRSGRIDPARCGLSSLGIAGEWFVAGSVVRDLAALNKREMLPWDYWGIARDLGPGGPVTQATAEPVDRVAALTADADLDWSAAREAYEHDDCLAVRRTVLSYPRGLLLIAGVDGPNRGGDFQNELTRLS